MTRETFIWHRRGYCALESQKRARGLTEARIEVHSTGEEQSSFARGGRLLRRGYPRLINHEVVSLACVRKLDSEEQNSTLSALRLAQSARGCYMTRGRVRTLALLLGPIRPQSALGGIEEGYVAQRHSFRSATASCPKRGVLIHPSGQKGLIPPCCSRLTDICVCRKDYLA